jgi:hypothetical protein
MIKHGFPQKIIILISVLIFQNCSTDNMGAWKNDNIDEGTRQEMKRLNTSLVNAIGEDNPPLIKSMMHEKLVEKSGKQISEYVHSISKSFQPGNFRVLEEYYIKSNSIGLVNTVPASITNDSTHSIHYLPLNKETYIALLIPGGQPNEVLVTAVYGKYHDAWKLNVLYFGQYSIMGRTAQYYYELAKKNYAFGAGIDALLYASVADRCLRPANDIWQYSNENEISVFKVKITDALNARYHFPLTLDKINTKPRLFRIYPEIIREGVFPMIQYVSSIDLKDSTALKSENEKIKKQVVELFKGINKNKKYIFYQAFNKEPDGKTQLGHFGFADRLEE